MSDTLDAISEEQTGYCAGSSRTELAGKISIPACDYPTTTRASGLATTHAR